MDEENVAYVFIAYTILLYYLALKRKSYPLQKREKLEAIILSEISQTQKDKYCMISLVCEM